MIETEGGESVLLTSEEFFELARKMTPEEFQGLVLDTLRKQSERINETLVAAHAKVSEMAEEICRLKAWTGVPEKNDPRGPAPHTLWQMAGVTRDLLLRVWTHLGLPEDQIMPPTKGGVN
jgi:hypothetical protein